MGHQSELLAALQALLDFADLAVGLRFVLRLAVFRLPALGSGLGVTRICAMCTRGSARLKVALLAL
jgi:hypothetical protein